MNWTKGIFLVLVFLPASWTRVSRLNDAIDQAAASYAATEYEQSIKNHRVLVDEFQVSSTYLDFNLGLSYQYASQPEEAAASFDKASQSTDKFWRPLPTIKGEWSLEISRTTKLPSANFSRLWYKTH